MIKTPLMNKILLVLAISVSFSAFGVKEYYGLSRSIRSLGMGGAFYGLSNDEYALFYNPAGLSLYNTDWEWMLRVNSQMAPSTLGAFKTLTNTGSSDLTTIINNITPYQGTPLYAGIGLLPYFVKKHFAVGLLLADTKVDMALLGRDLDTLVDVSAFSDSGLVIGYGLPMPFLPDLHVGVNAKGLLRAGGRKTFTVLDIAQNQSITLDPQSLGGAGVGFDFDLGTSYVLPQLPLTLENRVSLVFSNLLASEMTIAQQGSHPPKLSRTVSLGTYTVFPGAWLIDNFHLVIDIAEYGIGGESDQHFGARKGTIWKHINFGVEMPMRQWFTVRTGFHQGYLTAGFSVNLKYMKVDFATYAEEVSQGINRINSRRLALSLAFGGGASPPAPITEDKRFVPVTPAEPEPSKVVPKETPRAKETTDAILEPEKDPKSTLPTDTKPVDKKGQ